ncbi:MAG: hypothetical protein J0H14_11260 [Alphaproteobacteria bacterium]|nr:hypothetical protein [Alphaproteobacteria bacterium]
MAEDEEQRPESLLPYNDWTEEALRHVVVRAIAYAAEHGLPGEHHFYLTFRTDHPGTVIPPRLRAQYPQVMTIVLQHQFWDLNMDEEAGLITVGLSFGGVPATLAIPLAAVTAFADPHVRFGLQFRTPDLPADEPEAPEAAEPGDGTTEEAAGQAPAEEPPQVVSLDAFRRRTPPKP